MNLGERIKDLRQDKKLTQRELAIAIGVNKSAISFWEIGENEPKASYIFALAQFFDVSTDYLLGNTDEWGNQKQPTQQKERQMLSADEHETLELYRSISSQDKEKIKTALEVYSDAEQAKKQQKKAVN